MWDWDQLIYYYEQDARRTRRNKAALEMGIELDMKQEELEGGLNITYKQNKAALEMGIEGVQEKLDWLDKDQLAEKDDFYMKQKELEGG
eukprot:2901590-Heterocapsa_arctica.AAC.1